MEEVGEKERERQNKGKQKQITLAQSPRAENLCWRPCMEQTAESRTAEMSRVIWWSTRANLDVTTVTVWFL